MFDPILPQHVDSTMLTSFRSCPRHFYNEFVRGMRPNAKSVDLHAGGVIAATIEYIYKRAHAGIDTEQALAEGEIFFYRMWGDFAILNPKEVKTPENCWASILQYTAHYGILTDKLQPYYVDGKPTFEYSFAIPLDFPGFPAHPVSGDPFVFVGRFDRLASYNGLPIIADDKTTKAAGPDWASKWDLRGQFLGYLWALRHIGIETNWVCVRGLVIQKTDPRQLESITPYSNELIDRWAEQLRRDLWRIVACWRGLQPLEPPYQTELNLVPSAVLPLGAALDAAPYFDYNFGDSCHSFKGCMFKRMCESPTNAESWESSFVESRWNPLLLDPLDPTLVKPTLEII